MDAALRTAEVPHSALSVVAFPIDAPQRGLRLNADRPMPPASTMKLVTAAVALDRLGPNSRGKTELLVAPDPDSPASPDSPESPDRVSGRIGGIGTSVEARLSGPLYLKGGADLDLDSAALWQMLRELRERHGVRDLDGGIVVDRSLFQPARPDLGLDPFDEQPEFPYNVVPDALNLDGSLLELTLWSDDRSVQARAFPAIDGLEIDTRELGLNDSSCADWDRDWRTPRQTPRAEGGPRVVLQGSFPRGCQVRQRLQLVDRQQLTAQSLRQLWTRLGGTIGGEIREGRTPPTARTLVQHQDRPLAEALRQVLKRSDNPGSRLIFDRLGAAVATEGESTRAAAERQVRGWLTAQGLSTDGLVLENGSGLSRTERMTATQLSGVLAAAQRGAHGPELLALLPVAGVDGTLSRRFKGTAAQGRARMKTGTLRDVVALAGYVPDASGRLWVVVAMVQDDQASRARPAIDALVDWVAAH